MGKEQTIGRSSTQTKFSAFVWSSTVEQPAETGVEGRHEASLNNIRSRGRGGGGTPFTL